MPHSAPHSATTNTLSLHRKGAGKDKFVERIVERADGRASSPDGRDERHVRLAENVRYRAKPTANTRAVTVCRIP